MKIIKPLVRMVNESDEHFKAREILYNYFVKKFDDHDLQLWAEYPPEGRRKGDLVIDFFKPPLYKVKYWIEVQDTKLSLKEWYKRINDIIKSFNPEQFWIALTEKSSQEVKKLKKIQKLWGFNFTILVINTLTEEIIFLK